ncbi:HD-GYP domain-containing protein [Leptospirillum ferriphilum]|uniref:Response regulator/sensory box/HDIG domain protein n=2 Tax=Leptospirillum TaxID=179 RepID=A0A094WBJ5_9BACT|nr:HD domain-containing phosphohydrolase [Leptospirillum ferriphilum]EDZ39690.1 MAG: Probable metal-dependent phosphohydrolase [Leptospirillum sp. Group II '5-way CG']KGA94933.1 response regulator/sensory box/HDIG domain protein [Leptospirillum ferriphilum]
MKKTISISKLKPGMKVVGIDKSWLETPFLSHHFVIRSEKDIEKLLDSGVQLVTIEVDDLTREKSPSEESREEPHGLLELPSEDSGNDRTILSLQRETTRLLTRAFQQVRISGFLPTDEIRSHVRQTVDFLLHNRQAISLLADIHENDDETYVHSANTMFMAAAFAIRHQMEDAECFRWALAALLHDVGKTRIPEHILKKPGPLDLLEWEVMHQHPIYGFQILRKSPDPEIHGLAAQVAVEHHERLNGSGYPHHLGLDAVHPVSRSLMVLDIYEALTGHRVYRARSSPRKVIHYLMNDYSDRVSVPVILELASMVGIFPVGTFVENEDGEILMIQKYEDAENYRGEMTVLKIFGPGKKILPRPQKRKIGNLDPATILRTYDYRAVGLTQEQWEYLMGGGAPGIT